MRRTRASRQRQIGPWLGIEDNHCGAPVSLKSQTRNHSTPQFKVELGDPERFKSPLFMPATTRRNTPSLTDSPPKSKPSPRDWPTWTKSMAGEDGAFSELDKVNMANVAGEGIGRAL
jgi:hypothetical protein